MSNVFLSYAAEDRALARTVHGWLVDDGHEVFEYLDPRDGVALGGQWEQQLRERLRWADAMVCVVTSAYLASTWCTAEVGVAWSRGTLLLPIFAEPGVTHPVLASTHYADYARDPEAARVTVIEALRRVREPWWSRSRRPEWLRRALRPGRRAIAGLIASAVAVGLGAAGLILVLDRDTVDAATQQERDADPCPLLDTAALRRFGEPKLTTPQYLESCLATIASPGHETFLRVAFESARPLTSLISGAEPGQIEPLGGLHIKWGREDLLSDRRECTHRLWVDEGKPVIAFETRSYDKNPIDLCKVGHTAVMPAITELASNSITYKENRTGNFTHAQSDACSLLDATALGKVPGLDPDSAEPEYGRWRCAWSGSDGHTEVTLELMLQEPGFTGDDEGRTDVDGKPANVSGDSDGCSADVVHRPSPEPGRATEMLHLGLEVPGSIRERLCTLVTDLAIAAEKRLQSNDCRNGGILQYVLCWLALRS